jgi:hypothetical protein
VGAASGKLDALLFIAGMILGILGFAEIYPHIVEFAWSGNMGVTTLSKIFGMLAWWVPLSVVGMALMLFWVAAVLEKTFS